MLKRVGLRRTIGIGATVGVALAASMVGAGASPRDDLQAAKAATARYHAVERAEADGYVPASACESSPAGTMGIHYVKPALLADPALDPTRPEVLLYVPKKNGELELVGVEYFKADADQDLATSDDRPSLFAQPFDGPMPGHTAEMPIHYDLHVWLWADNPSGLFAMWNPKLACPA